ncbi:MAG: maltose ABC transporter permease MalF [Burkholderiales bacterium PBB6]|nr:MAG: maltose ABC transporter permease MalF [Burkholderiales bacterium PBB6]
MSGLIGRWQTWQRPVLGVLWSALVLWGVVAVHAAGQSLLAMVLLAVGGLAVWTYQSSRSGALRYLLPGIATALIFVIFPMLYTFGLSFTNYSARNLLERDRAQAQLREESLQVAGSQRAFSLHAAGSGWRVRLAPAADSAAPATTLLSAAVPLQGDAPLVLAMVPATEADLAALAPAAPLREHVDKLPALRALQLQIQPQQPPQQQPPTLLRLSSLREFAQTQPLYDSTPEGGLRDRVTGTVYLPDESEGFFTSASGEQLQPGFRVNVGLRHYLRIFSDERFREPFASVFMWTVVFSALTVVGATALGLLLAVLLNWDALECRPAYRLVLFLPYAVPGFISILVFKGLFNQNLGEINLILNGLFGIKPAWFSDPLLAKTMLLIVNIWLGFPYMMVLCSGLIKSIPADLYEASAVAGAGPWVNFSRITMPLILKPLTPLLISAFAFNFNNFVLISLLTGGAPDQLDTALPAGTTDILVSYTWRIAFQDSGQQFGLAAAISTVIFLIVAAITLVQMRTTRINDDARP